MSAPDFFSQAGGLLEGKVRLGEPMSLHTSWRIGGPAEVFAEPRGLEDLLLLIKYARRYGMPLTVIGAGTNLLVKDGGIDGLVVQIGGGFADLQVNGATITAGGGVRLSRLAAAARDAGWGGFEFLAGIPGTVGGAVVMNAGANGSTVGDLVSGVTCVDVGGNVLRLERDRLIWGYRSSGLQGRDLIVLEAAFGGIPRERELIAADMERYLNSRKSSQPLEYPNSGSVFKNPPGNYAGKLIQEAGCRGMRIGDAQVSEKHANFIINKGKAKAREVLELIDTVRSRVRDMSGITLELEVKVMGRD
jgi:UDP-N-acetylmuramate dehydrogenase